MRIISLGAHRILCHNFNQLKHRIRTFCIGAIAFVPLTSFAANLGQHGALFAIEEQDFLTVIENRLRAHEKSGRLAEFTQELEEEMRAHTLKPKSIPLSTASANRTRKLDPTVFLSDDIVIDNKVLYPKGTRINPLEYMRFQKLVFIDGRDGEQAEFARGVIDMDMNATIILVNGKPGLHTVNSNDYFYYFDQSGIYSQRFNIARVPSVVYQDGDEKVLTVQEVNLRGNR